MTASPTYEIKTQKVWIAQPEAQLEIPKFKIWKLILFLLCQKTHSFPPTFQVSLPSFILLWESSRLSTQDNWFFFF